MAPSSSPPTRWRQTGTGRREARGVSSGLLPRRAAPARCRQTGTGKREEGEREEGGWRRGEEASPTPRTGEEKEEGEAEEAAAAVPARLTLSKRRAMAATARFCIHC
jgi:hypothetical protein